MEVPFNNDTQLRYSLSITYFHQETKQYQMTHYSVSSLSSETINMKTGQPMKEGLTIVAEYAAQFKESVFTMLSGKSSRSHLKIKSL